uniref:Uncharacterized protein n=1 Tax=Chenopodium quinoa TaxID=63459 RepID=A0A803KRN8_CHEQI
MLFQTLHFPLDLPFGQVHASVDSEIDPNSYLLEKFKLYETQAKLCCPVQFVSQSKGNYVHLCMQKFSSHVVETSSIFQPVYEDSHQFKYSHPLKCGCAAHWARDCPSSGGGRYPSQSEFGRFGLQGDRDYDCWGVLWQ